MPENARRRPLLIHKDTNKPVKFYLEGNISRDIREYWTDRIQRYGGEVVKKDYNSEMVFISKTADRHQRQLAYAANPDARKRNISVQYLVFLEESIRHRTFRIPEEQMKGMSGTLSVRRRTNFTRDDDENLARYLAAALPDRESGGRTGNNIYIALCQLGETDKDYKWAKRHTWQSWRNRYKKNNQSFDDLISSFVPSMNPERKNRWGQDRRLNKTYVKEEAEEGEEEDGAEEEEKDKDIEQGEREVNGKRGNMSDSDRSRSPPRSTKRRRSSGNSRKDDPQDPPGDADEDERGRGGSNADEPRSPSSSANGHRSAEQDDWDHQYNAGVFENPGDPAAGLPTPQRRARFATSSPKNSEALEPESPTNSRRRYSFEASPAKQPHPKPTSSPGSKVAKRGVRVPLGFIPVPDTGSEDEDDGSTSDLDVAHSLFSDDEWEGDEAPTFFEDAQDPASRTTATTNEHISHEKTLVGSAPTFFKGQKERVSTTRLSSVSGGKPYSMQEEEQQGDALMEVEVKEEVQEEHIDVGLEDVAMEEPEEVPEDEAAESEGQSEPVPPEPELTDDPVEEPIARTARKRRRRTEQIQKAELVPAYRMTRSRSRSVEPEFASLSLQGSSKRKGKGKAKTIEPVEVIEEEPLEPQRETLADEEDVMNLVTNISNATSAGQESSATLSRGADSDAHSDDAQTRERMAAQYYGREAPVIRKGPRQSDALLQAFNDQTGSTGRPRSSLPNPMMLRLAAKRLQQAEPSRNVRVSSHQRASASASAPGKRPWKAPQTPTPVVNMGPPSRMRAVSAASSSNETTESIPVAGTRAEAYKRRLEEEQKHTPYTPPSGTRASMYLQQQQLDRRSLRRRV